MRSVKRWFPLGLLLASAICRADYYSGSNSYFNNNYPTYYSPSWSRHEEPIISLELNPQESLNSSFRIAAREGRLSDLEKYVHEGADINSVSDQGENALMYASRNCSERVVAGILKLKPDVNARDHQGRTALMYAASDSCLPVIKLLLTEQGIEVRVRDRSGRSALDYAEEVASEDVDGPSIDAIHALKSALRRGTRIVQRDRR